MWGVFACLRVSMQAISSASESVFISHSCTLRTSVASQFFSMEALQGERLGMLALTSVSPPSCFSLLHATASLYTGLDGRLDWGSTSICA